MPLRVEVRADTGTLWITGTVRPAGEARGIRIRQRAGTDDIALAREEAAAVERQILRDHHLGAKPAERGFAEAVKSYLRAEDRSLGTIRDADRWLMHFAETKLSAITQEAVDNARAQVIRAGGSDATWRRTVAVLSAILNHASRRGWCARTAFDLPAVGQGRTAFLLPDAYERLEAAAAPHLRPLLRYLVCTGCRLGETVTLQWQQVDLAGARVTLWADQTKAGRQRVVTLPPAAIIALAGLQGRDGAVFRTHRGEPFRPSDEYGGQIKTALATAATRASVEIDGAHALRHTFASWHYALNRDLLALKSAGGWSSVTLVERYAHLVPVGHEDAIRRIWGVGGGQLMVVSA